MEKYARYIFKTNVEVVEFREGLFSMGMIYDYEKREFYNIKELDMKSINKLIEWTTEDYIEYRVEFISKKQSSKYLGIYEFEEINAKNFFIKFNPGGNVHYYINFEEENDELKFHILDLSKNLYYKNIVPIEEEKSHLTIMIDFIRNNPKDVRNQNFDDSFFLDVVYLVLLDIIRY